MSNKEVVVNKKELMVVLVALTMLAGFISGIFVWSVLTGEVAQPVAAALPDPYIDVQMNTPVPPTPEPTTEPQLRARLSYYWPPNLGPNCHPDNVVDGQCTSWLTDGQRWHHWSWWHERYATVACPRDWKLGTKFYIPALKNTFLCIDRGGEVYTIEYDGSVRLDILQRDPIWVPDGEVVRDKFSPAGSYIVDFVIVQ
jgi:hypothetical protein|tara:strand:+ start:97 stop:690 length:594 start_codon:yes stop_codon:yes gene_type:complete